MLGASVMRFLYASDLHYALKQFDWLLSEAADFDLVVIGGDLLDLSSALDADVQITIVEKYLELLRQKTTLVVCSGNHDGDSRNEADESVAAWLRAAGNDRLYVDGDSFDMGDTRITVCPWCDGEVSRAEVEAQLVREALHVKGRWVWIYHAPPEGSRTSWTGRRFIGDEFLTAMIKRFNPAIVMSGHIHNSPFYAEGGWVDRIDRTWVFNPGRQLGAQPATIIVDMDAMTAEWSSQEGHSVQDIRIEEG
jgi:Icc-related predicted phosphoesterase